VTGSFIGAKAALFHCGAVLTLLRDTHPGLPWPGMWDLPGGGREGKESPEECLLREVQEEFGILLSPHCLTWRVTLPAISDPSRPAYFFAGNLSREDITAIRFGDEGQGWAMMPTDEFLNRADAIPEMQQRLHIALTAAAIPQ
jgi:8-oxo-dGTP diphosphatase